MGKRCPQIIAPQVACEDTSRALQKIFYIYFSSTCNHHKAYEILQTILPRNHLCIIIFKL